MKLNQFARLNPSFSIKKQELYDIGFQIEGTFQEIVRNNFYRLFPMANTVTTKKQFQAEIIFSNEMNLAEFLETDFVQITNSQFNNIALQLIGFDPITEYDINDPIKFMKATKLPYINDDITDIQQFLEALYLLLSMRTKKLVTYLDYIANMGFFVDHKKYNSEYLIFNGKVQNTFSTDDLVKEVVWVESDLDTDFDNKKDLLQVVIMRPKATDYGLKAPVIFTANPYFYGTNDVEWITHKPSSKLEIKDESILNTTYKKNNINKQLSGIKTNGEARNAEIKSFDQGSYSLNEYFLARGFVNVYSAGVGTKGSDGLRSVGGQSETDSAVAVIQWLTGKRKAFTNKTDGIEIKAWWSNGSVAMTGKSYLGTLAIAAATSGVAGLKTIIAEAGISSWYDYYRENGLVVAPGGYQGEDADVLAVDTFSRQKSPADYLKIKDIWEKELADITNRQDRKTGNYNSWWDERNYRNHLDKIKCDIIGVQGLNDWNVKPKNIIKLFEGLQKNSIIKKLFLHQGQHVYINNVLSLDFTDMMNLWLSYELLDIENGAKDLPDILIQDNVEEQTWRSYDNFAQDNVTNYSQKLSEYFTAEKNIFFDNSTKIFNENKETSQIYEEEIIKPDCIYNDARVLLTDLSVQNRIIEGTPRIKLSLKVDKPTAIVSVRLIDLGEDYRLLPNASVIEAKGYQLGFEAGYDNIVEFKKNNNKTLSRLISFGHINLQNKYNSWENKKVIPNKIFEIEFELQPTHYQLKAGHKLGLIIHGADMAQTHRVETVTGYEIDFDNSYLTVPYRN